MKKLIAILLFISLILPFAVTYSVLKFEKKQVKRSIKHKIIEGIKRDKLVLLAFSKQETESKLKWKHAKEFEYLREMYDIVETSIRNDSIFYYCWWDNEETELNKQLAQTLSGIFPLNAKKTENEKRLNQFSKSLFFNPILSNSFKTQTSFNKKENANYSFFELDNSIEIPTPPPLFL